MTMGLKLEEQSEAPAQRIGNLRLMMRKTRNLTPKKIQHPPATIMGTA
jgi:hypothetical protein